MKRHKIPSGPRSQRRFSTVAFAVVFAPAAFALSVVCGFFFVSAGIYVGALVALPLCLLSLGYALA